VVVPATAALGTSPGLRLYGSPASLITGNASGPLPGGMISPMAAPGTPLGDSANVASSLGSLGGLAGLGGLGGLGDSQGFAFPANMNLGQLTLPQHQQQQQQHWSSPGLADALLSPMSLSGYGQGLTSHLQQQQQHALLGLPRTPPAALGHAGFPGFGLGSSSAAASAAAMHRRASESSGMGGYGAGAFGGAGWSSVQVPSPQHMQQQAFQQQQQQGVGGTGLLPDTWPNMSGDASGMRAMHAIARELRQLNIAQQQQQQQLATGRPAPAGPSLQQQQQHLSAASGAPRAPPAAAATAARPPCPAVSPVLLSPAASGGQPGAPGNSSSNAPLDASRRAMSGHLSGQLHLLNPGLMGLIGSSDPSLMALGGRDTASSEHLMSWLSSDELSRGGAGGSSSGSMHAAGMSADPAAAAMRLPDQHSGPAAPQAAPEQQQQSALADTNKAPAAAHLQQQQQQPKGSSDVCLSRMHDQGPAVPPGIKPISTAAATAAGAGATASTQQADSSAPPGVPPLAPGSAAAAGASLAASVSSGSMSMAGSVVSAGGSMAHSYSGRLCHAQSEPFYTLMLLTCFLLSRLLLLQPPARRWLLRAGP
jgi:hypothetical protein